MKTTEPRWSILGAVFGYALLVRLLPYFAEALGMRVATNFALYPWNFSPLYALCLFGGAYFRDRWLSVALPGLVMLGSDLGIWALTGHADWAFYPGQWSVYVSVAVFSTLGFLLRQDQGALRIATAGLAGSTWYFLFTNLVHWASMDTYPHTPAGLWECYVAALPFYRNMLLGTAVFSGLLFSPFGVRVLTSQPASETQAQMSV